MAFLIGDMLPLFRSFAHREIQKFPNALTYGGSLTCANSDIAKSTLELPKAVEMLSTLLPENERWWLEHVICSDLKKSVLFLNTDNLKASEAIDQHNRIYNEIECKLVITLVTVLIKVRALVNVGN